MNESGSEVSATKKSDEQPPTWTVFVYLHADHNFSKTSDSIFQELVNIGADKDDLKIVIYWDRRISYSDTVKGKVTSKSIPSLLSSIGEQDSDNCKTLAMFMKWGVEEFSSSNYGLILFDHGAQWFGFGGDETNKDNNIMSILDIAAVINGFDKKLKFLGFDACLMGGIEVLYAFQNSTEILIANPENEFGTFFDYHRTLKLLKATQFKSLNDFLKNENIFWMEKHNKNDLELTFRSHSIYNMENIVTIVNLLNEFSEKLIDFLQFPYFLDSIKKARSEVIRFGHYSDDLNIHLRKDLSSYFFIDLGDFACLLKKYIIDGEFAKICESLIFTINKCVVEKTLGSKNANASGMSIWMPLQNQQKYIDDLNKYLNFFQNKGFYWGEFLKNWLQIQSEDKLDLSKLYLLNSSDRNLQIGFTLKNDYFIRLFSVITGEKDNLSYISAKIYNRGENFEFFWDKNIIYVVDKIKNRIILLSCFQNDFREDLFFSHAEYQENISKQKINVILIIKQKNDEFLIDSIIDTSGISSRSFVAIPGGKIFPKIPQNVLLGGLGFKTSDSAVVIPENGLSGIQIIKQKAQGEYVLSVIAIDWSGKYFSEHLTLNL